MTTITPIERELRRCKHRAAILTALELAIMDGLDPVAELEELVNDLRADAQQPSARAPEPSPASPPHRPARRARKSSARKPRKPSAAPTPAKPEPAAPRPAADDDLDDQVYAAIEKEGEGDWIGAGKAYRAIPRDVEVIRRSLARLVAGGRLVRRGERAGTRYRPASAEASDEPEESDPALPTPAGRSRALTAQKRNEAVERWIRENPGQEKDEIAVELDLPVVLVTAALTNLHNAGKVHLRPGGGYQVRGAEMPSDDDGAKTGAERRLVEAIRAFPGEPTTAEVAANAGVNAVDAALMLGALDRRGVVRAIPRKNESSRQRWALAAHPTMMSDRYPPRATVT